MACEDLPLITDEVGRSTKQPEISTPQSLGGSTCSLIFDNIMTYLEKWSCMTITFLITGSSQRGMVSLMDVKSTCNNSPGPLQVKGFSGAIGGAASNFLQQPHF